MSELLNSLRVPVIQAPMGGGPSTPELAAAVSGTGGIGFLAAGYRSAAELEEQVEAARGLTHRFGVNLFTPGPAAEPAAVAPYVEALGAEAARYRVEVGEPRHSDDDWEAKLELLRREPVPVVSFTFGCPSADVLAGLRGVGSEVWVTVTSVVEARAAVAAGAQALIAQGAEAGAHQGSYEDAGAPEPFGLVALLQLLAAEADLPVIASGGIATGAGLAAALSAGAAAAQIGTAFMLCPEAGTSEVHRRALEGEAPTALTRAFTGRRARGIVNRFLAEHEDAPSAYPEVHYATAPLRAAARQAGDPEAVNLWAGQAYPLARAEPAADVVTRLVAEAEEALSRARQRL